MSDIAIVGDLYIAKDTTPSIADNLRHVIKEARHSLVNLEAPVTDSQFRIRKTGPHLTMDPSVLTAVQEMEFTGLTLANNHILDAGLTGVAETIRLASEHGFDVVGASAEKQGARLAARLQVPVASGTLSVFNYCENEWSVAPTGAGASAWNVIDAASDIIGAKKDGDKVLIVLHGGNEYFPLPRPGLRKQLRFLAEIGADAIVMHHSHVPAAYEVWGGVPIFYGLGNFIFTLESPHPAWFDGLLVQLTFPESAPAEFDIVPLSQNRRFDVSVAEGDEALFALNEIEARRLIVSSDDALQASWDEFSSHASSRFSELIFPSTRFRSHKLRRLLQIMFSRQFHADANSHKASLNYIRCESLHEALVSSLQARYLVVGDEANLDAPGR